METATRGLLNKVILLEISIADKSSTEKLKVPFSYAIIPIFHIATFRLYDETTRPRLFTSKLKVCRPQMSIIPFVTNIARQLGTNVTTTPTAPP